MKGSNKLVVVRETGDYMLSLKPKTKKKDTLST